MSSQLSQKQATQGQREMKLKIKQIKRQKPTTVYSSRRHSQSNSINIIGQGDKNNKNRSISTLNKTINELALDEGLLKNLKLFKMRKLRPDINLTKKYCQSILQHNTRQNRYKLVQLLQQIHPFFSKIHSSIAQAIVLLSKAMVYYKGQLIFDTIDQQKNYVMQKINGRSKQDLGFLIYGKLQLANDRQFYSHYLTNSGTLFEDKFLNRSDKNPYFVSVSEPSFILWLSKESYYVIRRQCFLTLDLKYEFGQFQNLLKFNMVNKNLLNCPKI